jgi:hypothetical protein
MGTAVPVAAFGRNGRWNIVDRNLVAGCDEIDQSGEMNGQVQTSLGWYRLRLLVAASLVAVLGIASRVNWVGSLLWDKYVGDAAYAAIFYLALSLIWTREPVAAKAILTSGYVAAIELFQLTPIPAQLNQSDSFVVRAFAYIVLGSAFSWWDLLAYGIGIAGILLLDRKTTKPSGKGGTPMGEP